MSSYHVLDTRSLASRPVVAWSTHFQTEPCFASPDDLPTLYRHPLPPPLHRPFTAPTGSAQLCISAPLPPSSSLTSQINQSFLIPIPSLLSIDCLLVLPRPLRSAPLLSYCSPAVSSSFFFCTPLVSFSTSLTTSCSTGIYSSHFLLSDSWLAYHLTNLLEEKKFNDKVNPLPPRPNHLRAHIPWNGPRNPPPFLSLPLLQPRR